MSMTCRTSSPVGSQDGSKPSTPTSPRTPTTGRFAAPNLSSPVFSDVYRPSTYAQAVASHNKIPQMPLPASPRFPSDLRPNTFDFQIEPTQAVISIMQKLLDDCDRNILSKSNDSQLPQRFTTLMRRGLQELDRRHLSQAKQILDQTNIYRQREEKLKARLQVKETLAANSYEDSQGPFSPRSSASGSPRYREDEITKLMKEKEENIIIISKLKEDLDSNKKSFEEKCKEFDRKRNEVSKLVGDKESADKLVSKLEKDLEASKKDLEFSRRYIDDYKKDLEDSRKNCYEQSRMEKDEICKLIMDKENTKILILQMEKDLEDSRKNCDEQSRMEKDEISKLIMDKENTKNLILQMEKDLEDSRRSRDEKAKLLESNMEDMNRLTKEMEEKDEIISKLKQELEETKSKYEKIISELENRTEEMKSGFEMRLEELEFLLEESKKRAFEIEANSEAELQNINHKKLVFESFMGSQLKSMKDLKLSYTLIKHDVINSQNNFSKELNNLGQNLQVLVKAANRYHAVLTENRKLHNEVQELKGNIRVYCRIRPFLPGEDGKSTSIDSIGDNGELVLSNPLKSAKEGNKMFSFNKVFAQSCSQQQVFSDIQPLVRSVLDGYNVCIFAYGQTGSGKTYTMTGPNNPTEKDWGVNYRALNDLFNISLERKDTILYEVGVQMIEIYNEQVRDLLTADGVPKKLGIVNASQPNGLSVPDAAMHTVNSTSDVIRLMELGFSNRAVGATALNDRSSRSHSILTIHVRGQDLKTEAILRGSLHMVDLAGSERVDRSEVTGDRLKEAQHINKSLSALGDVIFSLAQKNAHVPYRNSKLTQVLQSSLGGHAKTLMFVQVNPDATSYSETLSTLKFAERVSSVELGAAKSNKEGKDLKELMEQVSYLKDMISKKDEEIERLQILRTSTPRAAKTSSRLNPSSESQSLKHSSSSPGMSSLGRHSRTRSMDPDVSSESRTRSGSMDMDNMAGFDNDSEDKLSDISDGELSMGTETDGSNSLVEYAMFPDNQAKDKRAPSPAKEKSNKQMTRIPKPSPLKVNTQSPRSSVPSPKIPSPSPLRSVKTKDSATTPKSTNLRKMASTQAAVTASPKTPSKGGWK